MSFQTVLAVVGTVMGAKSLVEGLKEGNLLKAVVGGFGAYMGLNSLGAFGAAEGTAAGASTVSGTEAGAIESSFGEMASSGVEMPVSEFSTAGVEATSGLSEGAGIFDSGAAGSLGFEQAGSITPSFDAGGAGIFESGITGAGAGLETLGQSAASGGGIFDSLQNGLNWMENNPKLTGAGLQLAGSYMQGEQLKDRDEMIMNENERLRRLRSTPGRAPRMRFNPQTRRMEMS